MLEIVKLQMDLKRYMLRIDKLRLDGFFFRVVVGTAESHPMAVAIRKISAAPESR